MGTETKLAENDTYVTGSNKEVNYPQKNEAFTTNQFVLTV